MNKSRGTIVLEQIKEIVEATKLFKQVSFGRVKEISEEDVFNSCYIIEFEEEVEHDGTVSDNTCSYDRRMIVDFHLNLSFEYDLEYKDIQAYFDRIMLQDGEFWTKAGILDRVPMYVAWDNNEYFDDGKKQGMLRYQIWYRTI